LLRLLYLPGYPETLILILLAVFLGCSEIFGPPETFLSIKKGMTETEVRASLGEPDGEFRKEDAPEEFFYENYWYPKRDVKEREYHTLLIYWGGSHVLYVFLDSNRKVVHVAIGGS